MEEDWQPGTAGVETRLEFVLRQDGTAHWMGQREELTADLAPIGLGRVHHIDVSFDVVDCDGRGVRIGFTYLGRNRWGFHYTAAYKFAKWAGRLFGAMEGGLLRGDDSHTKRYVLAEEEWRLVATEVTGNSEGETGP